MRTNYPRPNSRRPRGLHRIKEVRRQEGVSLRVLARQLNIDKALILRQEQPDCDLLLSELYQWSEALGVPTSLLLVDPDETQDSAIARRGHLVRAMKTALSIQETTSEAPTQNLVEAVIGQLIEIMPQLRAVSAWQIVGQRRRTNELGVAADRGSAVELPFDMKSLRRAG